MSALKAPWYAQGKVVKTAEGAIACFSEADAKMVSASPEMKIAIMHAILFLSEFTNKSDELESLISILKAAYKKSGG